MVRLPSWGSFGMSVISKLTMLGAAGSGGVKVLEGIQQAKVNGTSTADNDNFGLKVSISDDGNTAVVGAPNEDNGGANAGAAYVYARSGSSWSLQQKLQASDVTAYEKFGSSVAVSGDGETVAVGAALGGGGNEGSAYIFTRSGSTWTQQQKVTAGARAENNADFGYDIDLSEDGDTCIVGSRAEDLSNSDEGAAYVFTRSGSTWTQQQVLEASDAQSGDNFGYAVSISSDGNTAIVGAPYEDTSASQAGAAYVFTRSGSTWTEQQILRASNGGGDDNFGTSVSVSGDGNTVAVGAPQEDTTGGDAGAVYVFTRSGSTWTQQQLVQGTDVAANDQTGSSVALNSDGTVLLFAARNKNTGRGALYLFVGDGATWTQQQKITSSDAQDYDRLGTSLSLSGDSSTAISGAPYEDTGNSNAGAAYMFA